jgi:hypothetical protein
MPVPRSWILLPSRLGFACCRIGAVVTIFSEVYSCRIGAVVTIFSDVYRTVDDAHQRRKMWSR